MLGKFLKKTVLYGSGATIVAAGVLLFVPQAYAGTLSISSGSGVSYSDGTFTWAETGSGAFWIGLTDQPTYTSGDIVTVILSADLNNCEAATNNFRFDYMESSPGLYTDTTGTTHSVEWTSKEFTWTADGVNEAGSVSFAQVQERGCDAGSYITIESIAVNGVSYFGDVPLVPGDVLYSQDDNSTYDSDICTTGCTTFNGGKTSEIYASTTVDHNIATSSPLYLSVYLGLTDTYEDNLTSNSGVTVSIGSCAYHGLFDLDELKATTPLSPSLLTVELSYKEGDCGVYSGADIEIVINEYNDNGGNWNEGIASFTNASGVPYYVLSQDEPEAPVELPFSSIISMSPSGTTTATSTNFALDVEYKVIADDYEDGTQLEVTYYRQTNSQVAAVAASQPGIAPDSGVFLVDVPSAGIHTFSTTTSITEIGVYYYKAEIKLPEGIFDTIIGWFTWPDYDEEILIKHTRFTVVEESGVDQLYSDPDNVITDGAFGTFLDNLDVDACSFLSGDFNVLDCAKLLIFPPAPVLTSMWSSFVDNTLSTFPLGYVTRFVGIVNSDQSAQPPALTYTYGSSAPEELEGKGVSFQVFDAFTLIPTIVADDGSNKNIWDIIMPFWNTTVALAVLGVILHDLMRLGLPDFSGGGVPRAVDVQPYRVSGNVTNKQQLAPRNAHNVPIKNNTGNFDGFRRRKPDSSKDLILNPKYKGFKK